MVKFHIMHCHNFTSLMLSKAKSSYHFYLNSFADSHRQRIINWIDSTGQLSTAFDFTTKGILQVMYLFHVEFSKDCFSFLLVANYELNSWRLIPWVLQLSLCAIIYSKLSKENSGVCVILKGSRRVSWGGGHQGRSRFLITMTLVQLRYELLFMYFQNCSWGWDQDLGRIWNVIRDAPWWKIKITGPYFWGHGKRT